MKDLVSIILPSYNKQQFIAETIESVINQTYQNWELIIIDDNSSDGSIQVINKYLNKKYCIKLYLNHSNKGGNYCRNFGLQKAQGDYVIFLDADDILTFDCLTNRLREMIHDSDLDFCVFTMGNFNSKIGDNSYAWIPKSKYPLMDFIKHRLPWTIVQPIWKRDTLIKAGGFDESFPRFQDVELHTRILFINNIKFKQVICQPDCYYRITDERRNYDIYNYNYLRVKSCSLYYDKFFHQACDIKMKNKMLGCVYETYLQILNHTRTQKLKFDEFRKLENQLLCYQHYHTFTNLKRFLFKISRYYHLYLPRIPGINKILTFLILS